MTPFETPDIEAAFQEFDPSVRDQLLAFREMIFVVGASLDAVQRIEESLKWGQPSYNALPKTGTPIRLGQSKSGEACLFVHCQTTLVGDLASAGGHDLRTVDNRSVLLPKDLSSSPELLTFIRATFTYHV